MIDGGTARPASGEPDITAKLLKGHAIGGQLGYAMPKWHLGITLKYLYEYYAEDRFRGQALTGSIGYQF